MQTEPISAGMRGSCETERIARYTIALAFQGSEHCHVHQTV